MKVAVVGEGFMGQTHLNVYSNLPYVEIVGVCNIKKTPIKLAEQYQTNAYSYFEQMISETKPDVISICLPTYLHRKYVVKAAKAGVHIICEKPIAPSLEEAREMIDVCYANNVQLFVGHVVRFFPNYQDIQVQISSGAIGDVGVVHTKRAVSHPGVKKEWYNDLKLSGGVIMDLVIHDIDFVRSILGEVKNVYAMRSTSPGIEHALVTLKFENGAIANLEGLWGYDQPLSTSCEFAGKKGIIRFNSEDVSTLRINKLMEEDPPLYKSVATSPTKNDPFYYQLDHFLTCIRENKKSLITPEDAFKAVEVSLAAIQSTESGKPICLNKSSNKL